MVLFNNIINTFKNLDKKIIKIMISGLKFCFLITLISITILLIYIFISKYFLLYQIGLLVFQLSLYFSIDFIVAAFVIDTIKKQIK